MPLLPTELDVIVGLVIASVVPEFSTQTALSLAVDTEIVGLDSVFVPSVYASAAVAYASFVLSCNPQVDELDEELTVMETVLEVLVA